MDRLILCFLIYSISDDQRDFRHGPIGLAGRKGRKVKGKGALVERDGVKIAPSIPPLHQPRLSAFLWIEILGAKIRDRMGRGYAI